MSISRNRAKARHASLAIGIALFVTIAAGWFAHSRHDTLAVSHETVSQPSGNDSPEITAVALVAALAARTAYPESHRIAERLEYLERVLSDDSSLASSDRPCFVMSFGLMALMEANKGGRYDRLIRRTVDRLKAAQWGPARGCEDSDPSSGGTGYKPLAPPDLYHTSLAVEAIRRAGVSARDPYMQRALQFVSRCQDLPNPGRQPVSCEATDHGGFSIAPPTLNEWGAEGRSEDSLRPCGSLTCAGLTSLISCGVSKEDCRVKAAFDWLRRNYTLDANPGMASPRCRLYDYYLSLATALTALGEDSIVDDNNVRHNWRRELEQMLQTTQEPDGCWLNPAESEDCSESHPLVTTSLAMMTLCRIAKPQSRGRWLDQRPPSRNRSRVVQIGDEQCRECVF